jgi:hypothetical protein
MPCWPQAPIGMPRSRDSKIIKFSTLFVFHENDPTIWVRAKIKENSWYQDPRKIFLKKSNMPCWPQAHIGMPRSGNSNKLKLTENVFN